MARTAHLHETRGFMEERRQPFNLENSSEIDVLHLIDMDGQENSEDSHHHDSPSSNSAGVKAHRKNFEMQLGASESSYNAGRLQKFQYTHFMEDDWPWNAHYPIEASMKRLINEEMSKGSHFRRNSPSIVAKLMGMDMLPIDTKSANQTNEKKNESRRTKVSSNQRNRRDPLHQSLSVSSVPQLESSFLYSSLDSRADGNLGRLMRREHPQEEELQKFKRDFEAWQASRFMEYSRMFKLENGPRQSAALGKHNQNKADLQRNHRRVGKEKPNKIYHHEEKEKLHKRAPSYNDENKPEYLFVRNESGALVNGTKHMNNMRQLPEIVSADKPGNYSGPTTIVILKPGPESIWNSEESWTSFSETSDESGNIEDFLDEVKERLKYELQGKTSKRGSLVARNGKDVNSTEKSSAPRNIAQQIAKQVRESVTKEMGLSIPQSESARSYRSEIQLNYPGSPEFMNRDTRKFLVERLKNVYKQEVPFGMPIEVNDIDRSTMLHKERTSARHKRSITNVPNYLSSQEIIEEEQDMQTRSFERGHDSNEGRVCQELSPRNLVRSLSAPVSGTSFGKLLLEDRHIVTGAHIRRKHESMGNVLEDAKKHKKEKFNLKEKVHNFGSTFMLRGKLFSRMNQPTAESDRSEAYFMKDIMSGPTVIVNPGEIHENFTEVPPSPASVCSSDHEEFWQSGKNQTPISTPNGSPDKTASFQEDIKPITCDQNNCVQPRRQLIQVESERHVDSVAEVDQCISEAVEPEDRNQAFIKDLLLASGLYDRFTEICPSYDMPDELISNSVFQEVEEYYCHMAKENDSSAKEENEKEVVDHKVLCDLSNESLPIIVKQTLKMSRFRTTIPGLASVPRLCGQELLRGIWEIIHIFVKPPSDKLHYSVDSITGRDLKSASWFASLQDEVYLMGRDLENMIIEDLIEEIMDGMQLR